MLWYAQVSHQVFFHSSEQPKDVTLGVGDEVGFVAVLSPKGEVVARQLRRTKESAKPEAPAKKRFTHSVAQTLFAQAPTKDGGRGFPAGRGRPMVPAAAAGVGC